MIEILDEVDYVKKSGSTYKVFAIVLEYCVNGEFFDFVEIGGFPQEIARTYFLQLLEGLDYLHK